MPSTPHPRKKLRIRGTKKHMVKKPKVVVVKVYAEWCSHCKALAPEWERMEMYLKPHVMAIGVNSEKLESGKQEVKKHTGQDLPPVLAYPTIFRISKGKIEQYDGERRAKQMAGWANGGAEVAEVAIQGAIKGGKPKQRKTSRRKKGCKSWLWPWK